MYQAKILKNGADRRCRLCTHGEETISQIISGFSTILNTEYLQRQDRVPKFIYWTVYKHFKVPHTEKWYEHIPKPVVGGKNVTIPWDFIVHTDRKIDASRLDIIIKNMKNELAS